MYPFLSGLAAAAALIAAAFFFRFWKRTNDRFFALFAAALLLIGVERVILGVANIPESLDAGIYLVRLAAFLLILLAVAAKNAPARRKRRGRS